MGKQAEGITDGLTLPCGKCGQCTAFDYTVADEAWVSVVPDFLRLGVVCLPCFDLMAADAGANTAEALIRVQFIGSEKTIVLRPTVAMEHSTRTLCSVRGT